MILFNSLACIIYILTQIEKQIDAHRAPLAAIVLSSNGMYIATASEQGTIIRVHLVSDASKVRIAHHPFTVFYTWRSSIVIDYIFQSGCQRQPPHRWYTIKLLVKIR